MAASESTDIENTEIRAMNSETETTVDQQTEVKTSIFNTTSEGIYEQPFQEA